MQKVCPEKQGVFSWTASKVHPRLAAETDNAGHCSCAEFENNSPSLECTIPINTIQKQADAKKEKALALAKGHAVQTTRRIVAGGATL